MLRNLKTFSSIAAVAIVATLALSASAFAATRYASPTGVASASSACLQLAPCSLAGALDADETNPGDEVILLPGDYTVSSDLSASALASVRGTGLPSQTRILSTSSNDAFSVISAGDAPIVVSDLEIVANTSASGAALDVAGAEGGIVRRVIARNSSGKGCQLDIATVTDTICTTSANGGAAIEVDDGGTLSPILRNVTAVATNPAGGIGIDVVGYTNSIIAIDAKSVIARGQTADIRTTQPALSSVSIALSHSNYATADVTANGTITTPGTNSNQTAAPVFIDAASGDFRQAGTSPTIDAGITDVSSGLTDLLGAARVQGAGADIGAYETVRPPATDQTPPAVPDTRKPIVKLRSKPKKKSTKRRVRIRFTADEKVIFRCKLDRAKYRTCKSPYVKTVKPGKHKLTVIATDAAGNKSKAVAVRWTVKKLKS